MCWQDYKKDLTVSTIKKKAFGKTSTMMEGYCFIISVTSSNSLYSGKDDDSSLMITGNLHWTCCHYINDDHCDRNRFSVHLKHLQILLSFISTILLHFFLLHLVLEGNDLSPKLFKDKNRMNYLSFRLTTSFQSCPFPGLLQFAKKFIKYNNAFQHTSFLIILHSMFGILSWQLFSFCIKFTYFFYQLAVSFNNIYE